MKTTITPLLEQNPDWHFIVVWPKKTKGHQWVYTEDGFFKNPQIIRIPMEIPTRKMDMVTNWPSNYWRKVFKQFVPDVIWNHSVESTALFRSLLSTFSSRPPIISQHHYVIHESLPYPSAYMESIRFLQLGSMLGDYNLFNSDHCRKMLQDNIDEMLNKDYFDKNFKGEVLKFSVIPDDFPKPEPIKDKIRIIYNHRLQDYKHFFTTFDLLHEIWNEGLTNFEVIVTNPDKGNFGKLHKYPFVKAWSADDRDEYLDLLKTGHLNITNSSHETFCLSALESLAMGQILVAPNSVTFPELVPDNYKYLFDTKKQQKEILVDLLSKPETFETERKGIMDSTRKQFSIHKLTEGYERVFKQFNECDLGKHRERTQKAIQGVLKDFNGFVDYDTLQTYFQRKHNLGPQSTPRFKLKKMLNNAGCEDYFKGGFQQGLIIK